MRERAAAFLGGASHIAFLLLVAALPWTIGAMSIAVVVCAVLTVAAHVAGRPPRWPRTPVDGPALGWLLALVIAAVFAVDPAASAPRVTKGLLPLLVGLAALHAASESRGRRALGILLASSAIASSVGLGIFLAEGASFESRARGPTKHYMTFAGQLLLLVSAAAAVAWRARSSRWRLGAASAAVVGGAALVATFTRSAWLGLVVAAATIVASVRPRALVLVALAVVAVVVLAPGNYGARLRSSLDPRSPWNRERVLMWQAGARMFADDPLTGVGLQDLRPLYERYRSPEAREPAGHLHNVVVHIAATMGLVGLVAWAALVVGLVRTTTAGLFSRPRVGLAAGLRLGVTAGLAGFLVAGLFEWTFGDEELLDLLYVLVGMAWGARHWEGVSSA